MWVTPDGVLHTVALPDPSQVLTAPAEDAFRRLVGQEGTAVETFLEAAETDCYDDVRVDADDRFVAEAPPQGLVDRGPRSVTELREIVSAVPPRWRLDVVMALSDLFREIVEPPRDRPRWLPRLLRRTDR